MALSTKRSFVWSLSGQIVLAFSQWVILVTLARAGDASAVGTFTYALALTAPLVLLLTGRNVQVTDLEQRYSTLEYLGHRAIGAAGVLLTLGIVIGGLDETVEVRAVLFLVGLAKCIESIEDVLHGVFHRAGRLDLVTRSLAIRGLGSMVAFGLGFAGTHDLAVAILGTIAVDLATIALFDVPAARGLESQGGPSFRRSSMLPLFKLTMPLGIASMVASATSNVPRYVLEEQLGKSAVGIFSALAYVTIAGQAISQALATAITPRLAALHGADDLRGYVRLIGGSTALVVVLGLGGMGLTVVIGQPFLRLAYGPEYAAHITLLLWLVCGVCVLYLGTIGTAALAGVRSFRSQAIANGSGLLAAVVGAPLLTAAHGLVGAAAALLIAHTVSLLVKLSALWIALEVWRRRRKGPSPWSSSR